MYSSVEHYRKMLREQPFTIFSNHKPLILSFNQTNNEGTSWNVRKFDFIGQFVIGSQYTYYIH